MENLGVIIGIAVAVAVAVFFGTRRATQTLFGTGGQGQTRPSSR